MKLWLISQDENEGYDTYNAAVVTAETMDEARVIHPGNIRNPSGSYSWATDPKFVAVEYLGEATPGIESGVVLASFNAG